LRRSLLLPFQVAWVGASDTAWIADGRLCAWPIPVAISGLRVRHLYCERRSTDPALACLTIEPLPAGVPHAEDAGAWRMASSRSAYSIRITKISDCRRRALGAHSRASSAGEIAGQAPTRSTTRRSAATCSPGFARYGAPVGRIDFLGSSSRMDHFVGAQIVSISASTPVSLQNGGRRAPWESLQMGRARSSPNSANALSSRAAGGDPDGDRDA